MINKHLLFSIVFLLFITLSVFAQESQRSTNIKWIDGQKFYIHTVTKGQGFYTLKKIYNVSEKDILENNPETFDGLKLGQELKIPCISNSSEKESDYKIHTIKAGETIYSISKIYNVSPENILEINPEAKNGYKINQKLKIPLKAKLQVKKEEEIKSNKKTYKVKKKDTLYALSKKFGVSPEDFIKANPIIAQNGLQKGQKLIIPKKEIIIKEALYIPIDTLHNNNIENDTLPCDSSIIKRYKPMNIGLFLPFEIDKKAFEIEKDKISPQIPQFTNKPFLEFYQAFLLAVNTLKNQGLKLNIYTFNTKKDTNEIKQILKKRIIQDLDLIIGPVYKANFKMVQNATDSMAIPIVNPIIQNTSLIKNSPYTIEIFPSYNILMQDLSLLLARNDSSTIHFVHSGFSDDLLIVQDFKKIYLKTLLQEGKDTSYYFKELRFPDSKRMNIKPYVDKNKHNLFIILSDNQAFVSNVFTKLNILSKDYRVQVITRPKWKKFNNIDISYYHHLNALQISNRYVNYKEEKVIQFVEEYRKLYNTEPTKYAFLAFDISQYFIPYFYQWKRFSCLKENFYKGLSMNFDLHKTNKGWINHSIFLIHYDKDYNLIPLE